MHPGVVPTRIVVVCCGLFYALAPGARGVDELDQLKVGVQPDGRIVVPTNQILKPAGKQVTFPGRPVDLALTDDGKTLVVKNMRSLVFIDVATAKVKQTLALVEPKAPPFDAEKDPIAPSGKPVQHKYPVGFSVVGLLVKGDRVYATDCYNHIRVARRKEDGSYKWEAPIAVLPPKVGGDAFPAGLAAVGDDDLWVCSSRGNTAQLVSLKNAEAEQAVPVGVAPFMVVAARPDRLYVTNWGGNPPKEGDPQSTSSGSPVRIDPKTGVADRGTVSVLAPAPGRWKQVKTIRV